MASVDVGGARSCGPGASAFFGGFDEREIAVRPSRFGARFDEELKIVLRDSDQPTETRNRESALENGRPPPPNRRARAKGAFLKSEQTGRRAHRPANS